MDKKTFKITPEQILDPALIRQRAIQREEENRFQKIAEQIIEILKKENVLISEYPRLISIIGSLINNKIDKLSIEKIIKGYD